MPCSCSNTKMMSSSSMSSGTPYGMSSAGWSMRRSAPLTASAVAASAVPICASVPACPQCGGLECLCRPRWVAGMVVSEADLNRLDYYITAKQRLHNRYLFGTGTVCGLVVTCHPCGAGVVSVSPGYALGPCGEDIVVCQPDTVDVCALIQKCRSIERSVVECAPWANAKGCEDVQETWVLAIRYMEQPSRSAPMLRAANGCDCGCGGGGGCTCGGTATASPQPRPATPIACAPTVVCETYRYEVFRAPPQPECNNPDQQPPVGRLAQAVTDCVKELLAIVQAKPQDGLDDKLTADGKQLWSAYISRFKATLYTHLTRSSTGRCSLLEQLCQVVTPAATLQTSAFIAAVDLSGTVLEPIWNAALQDCICLALLPPCPDTTPDPRLPLALITVNSASECTITDICNWTPLRKIVGTAPNVGYWLSGFSLIDLLRQELFCGCCEPLQLQSQRLAGAPGLLAGRLAAAPEALANKGSFAGLGNLGLVGKWLAAQRPDPRDLMSMLQLNPEPAASGQTQQRIATLEAEVARLAAAFRQPPA
jgi:hypothetical protein